jgi:hypothetical protein
MSAVPVPGGHPVAGAARATTAVGTDVALLDPVLSVAVTFTRSVEPASAVVTPYDLPVAPLMGAQLPPVAEQRCHS